MGMFDYVRVEQPLPGGYEPADGLFQSKSFDCYMDEYRITVEGRLEKLRKEYEPNPDWRAEDEPKNDGTLNSTLARLAHANDATRLSRRWWEDTNFHGWMEFHDFVQTETGGVAYDYRAKFTDGELQVIEFEQEVIEHVGRGEVEATPEADPPT